MKKLIAILLSLSLLLALAACGKEATPDEPLTDEITEADITAESTDTAGEETAVKTSVHPDIEKIKAAQMNDSFGVKVEKIDTADNILTATVKNNTGADIDSYNILLAGVDENGNCKKVVDTISSGFDKLSERYMSFESSEGIKAGETNDFVAQYNSVGESDQIFAIIFAYTVNGEKTINAAADEWAGAVAYSDVSRAGIKEDEDAGERKFTDPRKLREIAEKPFDIDVESSVLYDYNTSFVGSVSGNDDAIGFNVTNNSGKTVDEIEFIVVGLRKDNSRTAVAGSIKVFTLNSQRLDDVMTVYAGSDDNPLQIVNGGTTMVVAEADCERFTSYEYIVLSYTTSDGTEVENPAAAEWLEYLEPGILSE